MYICKHRIHVYQGEPLVQHYLSNTCAVQILRIMQRIVLAVLEKYCHRKRTSSFRQVLPP